jgi:hypothetical protein
LRQKPAGDAPATGVHRDVYWWATPLQPVCIATSAGERRAFYRWAARLLLV